MTSTDTPSPPSIAVLGAGYWGKNLIRNFYQLGALKLICDNTETTISSFKNEYADVEVCIGINDVLSRKDIQGVVIATPAETHFPIAREALLSGKHVYVEKPLALQAKEAEILTQLATDNHLILMVGHLLQYHSAFIRLKEMVMGGELGRINYIYSQRLNLGKIRREENILWSFAPHDISMILSLAGEEPDAVLATGGNYLHQKIADVTTTHLEFPSGMKAHVFVSWLHPFKEQKLVVVGDKKMAVFNDTMPWAEKLLLYPHEIKWEGGVPVPAKGEPESVDIPQQEPLRSECQHFLQCIMTGQRPQTDGHEGVRVLKVLNASQRSLDEHNKKIRLQDAATHTGSTQKPVTQPYFVHPKAVVDENVAIGKGSKVWHFSHILSGSRIGEDCNIGQNVVIGPDVIIGKNCKIQNNVSVYKGVTIEDCVFCGPSMVFTNVYNPRAEIRKMDQLRPTLVKTGTTIGANTTIICGATIGRYAFIGAAAVITKDVPDYALIVGNPGKQVGWVCECGVKLDSEFICSDCGKKYPELKNQPT